MNVISFNNLKDYHLNLVEYISNLLKNLKIDVDTELDSTSNNPIANSTVANALANYGMGLNVYWVIPEDNPEENPINNPYILRIALTNGENEISYCDIDFPLEQIVVEGKYDSTNKEVVLTLHNGSEVRFSVADIVTGLASQDSLDTLSDSVDTIEEDLATLAEKVDNLGIGNLEQDITDLYTAVDGLDTRIYNLESKDVDIEDALSNSKVIEELSNHIDVLDDAQVQFGSDLVNITNIVNGAVDDIDGLQTSVTNLDALVDSYETRVTDLESDYGSLKETTENLDTRVSSNSANLQNLSGTVDAQVNLVNELKGIVRGYDMLIASKAQQSQVDTLEAEQNVQASRIDANEVKIATNITSIEGLNRTTNSLSGEVGTYSQRITDLESGYGELADEQTAQAGRIANNENAITNLADTKADKTALNATNTTLNNLSTEVSGYSQRITDVEADYGELEEKVDERAKTIEYSWESVGTNGVNPFKLNLTLKDANGTQLSTIQVDFPLEQMVVGAEYDKATKDLILYTTDGQVAIPVDDIFDGLATTTDLDTKLDKSGGWIYNTNTGSDTPLYVRADATASYIGYWDKAGTALGYLGFDANHTPKIYTTSRGYEDVIHSGNIGSQHVASATNLISSSEYGVKTDQYGNLRQITHTSGACWQVVNADGTAMFSVFFDGSGARVGTNEIIHSGNYSSYALPLTGGTISGDINANNLYSKGNIEGYIEAVQGGGGGYLRIDRIDNEVNLENTTNHCILLGKPYRDKIEFYEYGGEFNFYKSQENVNTLLLHIHPDAFQYKGQNVIHSGNIKTFIAQYLNETYFTKGY